MLFEIVVVFSDDDNREEILVNILSHESLFPNEYKEQ